MAPFLRPWQSWKSAKPVAFLVVLAFAIGIGSATAMYTVVDALLLKPIPFEHGERFVSVLGSNFDDPHGMSALTLKDAFEYQQRTRSFDLFGCFIFSSYNLTAPGQPQYLNGIEVTPDLVNGLGVRPQLGHWFSDASEPVAVLSHLLWVRLGADPAIVGKTVTLNGRAYTVTAVMPPGFNLPLSGPYGEAQMDIWLPLDPLGRGQARDLGNTFCYARLRPGVTLTIASTEVKSIAADIAKREPALHVASTARVDSLHELLTKNLRPVLLLLFGAVVLLLLITCANVGGLLVSRAVARARETALRVALGAGLRQLAVQYFLEGWFVAILGAAGGLLLSWGIVRVLIAFGSEQSVRVNGISMNWRAPVFALGTALLAGVLASLAPLWQATRMLPNEILNEGIRASAGTRSRRLSRSLVVGEIALAFVLLSLSVVLVSELYRLTRAAPGFDPSHLLTFKLTLAPEAFHDQAGRVAYQDRLAQALEAIPGVTGVGFVNQLPLEGCCFVTTIYPEGAQPNPRAPDRVSFLPVNPGYFVAMRIPLFGGRFLDKRDTGENPLPVVINQAAARRYWQNRNPVGLSGHFGSPEGSPFQVVGIVGDVRNNGLDNDPMPEIYLSATVAEVNPMHFVIRSQLPAKVLVPEILRAIRTVNPGQPVHDVRMMSDIVRDSLALKRAASYVMMFFALAALVMATIGTYGLISHSVRQRTVEFGTRMALGAVPRDLLRLVVGSGVNMAAWGIAIGGAAAIAATWLLVRNFEINVGNGGTGRLDNPGAFPFLFSAVVVGVVAMASSFFPAWWATLLTPMVAIRDEPGAREARAWPLTQPASRQESVTANTSLVTELIEASRRAGSYREALAAALEALRGSMGAQWVMLLESTSGGDFRTTVAVPHPRTACSIPGSGLLLARFNSYSAALPFTAADLDTWRRWAGENSPQHIGEIELLVATGARLSVALRTNKEVLGLLLLGAPADGEDYGHDKIRMLSGCAGQFALLVENARLTDRVLEQEKLRRDLALAADVQRQLMARQSLETAAISVAALSIPARSVGGDYYDLLELAGGRTGIALADVAGKGVPAALIMSAVQATLRVLSEAPGISLSDLVARMNHFLYASTGPSSYATFFYAEVDGTRLRYVNAGHNPPYMLRMDGASLSIEELSGGGTVIGMFPKVRYEESSVELRPGDVLAVFTDGVPEALNPREEEFGEERLKDALRRAAALPVTAMLSRLSAELHDWIEDAVQYDDLTFVLMKVR